VEEQELGAEVEEFESLFLRTPAFMAAAELE
jgi:hypothetical protein